MYFRFHQLLGFISIRSSSCFHSSSSTSSLPSSVTFLSSPDSQILELSFSHLSFHHLSSLLFSRPLAPSLSSSSPHLLVPSSPSPSSSSPPPLTLPSGEAYVRVKEAQDPDNAIYSGPPSERRNKFPIAFSTQVYRGLRHRLGFGKVKALGPSGDSQGSCRRNMRYPRRASSKSSQR